MAETKTARRKRCKDCDELFPADEVMGGLCEECDQHYTYCSICDESQHEDSACRHVFQCNATSWGWMGAGGHDSDWPYHKQSFLVVLDKTGLAIELRQAIEADTLETKYWGPMIGAGYYLCYAGAGESRRDYGNRFTHELTEAQEMAMTIGVGWLDSIQYGDSPIRTQARELTITWIDEWLSSPLRRLGAGYGLASEAWADKQEYEERRRYSDFCMVPLPVHPSNTPAPRARGASER